MVSCRLCFLITLNLILTTICHHHTRADVYHYTYRDTNLGVVEAQTLGDAFVALCIRLPMRGVNLSRMVHFEQREPSTGETPKEQAKNVGDADEEESGKMPNVSTLAPAAVASQDMSQVGTPGVSSITPSTDSEMDRTNLGE